MIKKYKKLNENMEQMEREMDNLKTFFCYKIFRKKRI